MKQIILSAALILSVQTIQAQQWNYSPSNANNIYNTNTGNVGIGTNAPGTKLHVNSGAVSISGNNPFGGPMLLLGPGVSNPNTWGIESTPSGLNFWRPFNGQANAGNFFLYLKHSNGNIGIKTDNPTAGLTVNTNVLIGDPTAVYNLPSGYMLYVQSGILTEKVKVAIKNSTNWSDFVFDDDYKIRPLSEVETFINKNKHLPDIPSAEEVVKNGVDLAEMDARLLQKVEELTLYIIRLEKEVDGLKQKQGL